ncbi:MAG: DUF2157 domain-containing protein [Gemmatimonadota bacterium]|nr:DUF2157 domain-containing protein [Gemmatimonadota bacterium]
MPSADQLRASAIIAFREELARLEAAGVLALDPAARDRLRAHHEAELAALAASGEVDLTEAAARLSAGMRIATLLGTIALSAAYGLFVSAHWGGLALAPQLALVIVPTFLLVILTHVAAVLERSGYVASLLATVAAIAFATNLGTLGQLLNLPDSRGALLAVGVFAMLLAYGYSLTLPLLVGIGGIGGWLWTLGAIPLGLWWREGLTLIEPLMLVGLLTLVLPAWLPRPAKFAPWYRGIGATLLILGLLVAAGNGQLSAIPGDVKTIEIGYKILGAIVIAGLVAWAIRRDQRLVMQIGAAGAVLYLFMRLVDWFWDWVPQWLFFLLVGGFALAVLLVLRRLRHTRVEAR